MSKFKEGQQVRVTRDVVTVHPQDEENIPRAKPGTTAKVAAVYDSHSGEAEYECVVTIGTPTARKAPWFVAPESSLESA